VAQHGAGPAGLHGSQELALERQAGMPDGIDAEMRAMQPSVANPDAHRIPRQAAGAQLVEREHAPLLRCHAGHAHIGPSVVCVGVTPTEPTLAAVVASHPATLRRCA
jgi:hypothetical protein